MRIRVAKSFALPQRWSLKTDFRSSPIRESDPSHGSLSLFLVMEPDCAGRASGLIVLRAFEDEICSRSFFRSLNRLLRQRGTRDPH